MKIKAVILPLGAVATLVAVAMLAQEELGCWRTAPQPLDNISAEHKHAFSATSPIDLRDVNKDWDFNWIVWENSVPLRDWTIDPERVRQEGGGVFLPRVNAPLFSSTDNTSPIENNRIYSITTARSVPPTWLAATAALAAICLVAAGGGRSITPRAWTWAAALGLLAVGAAVRLNLPAFPFAWPDSWGYYAPSLDYEATAHLRPTVRESLYPLFIGTVVHFTQSLKALVIAQHALNLAAGALLLLAFREIADLTSEQHMLPGLADVLGLTCLVALIFARTSDFYGHYLMPESIFPFFAALCLWANARFLRLRFTPSPTRRTGLVWGAVAILSLLLPYALIPRWGLGIFLVFPVAFLILSMPAFSRVARFVAVATPLLIFVFGYMLPDSILRKRSLPDGSHFLHMHLLSIHATAIKPVLLSAAAATNPPYPRELLLEVAADFDREFTRYAAGSSSIGSTPSLGFDADQLMYEDSAIRRLERFFDDDRAGLRRFCLYFYFRAWLERPGEMIGKIWSQLSTTWEAPNKFFQRAYFSYTPDEQLRDSARLINDEFQSRVGTTVWQTYPDGLQSRGENRVVMLQQSSVAAIHSVLAKSAVGIGCLVILSFLTSGIVLLHARPADTCHPLRRAFILSTIGLAAFLPVALGTSTVAIIHTLDLERYLDSQQAFSIFAVCAGAWLTLATWHLLIVAYRGRRYQGLATS